MAPLFVRHFFEDFDDVIDSRILSIFVLSTHYLATGDSIISPTYYRIESIIETRINHRVWPNRGTWTNKATPTLSYLGPESLA